MRQYLKGSSGVRILCALAVMCALAAGLLDSAAAAMGVGVFILGDTTSEETGMETLLRLTREQGVAFEGFKKRIDRDLDAMGRQLTAFNLAQQRPSGRDLGDQAHASRAIDAENQQFIDAKTGAQIPVLRHGESLLDLERKSGSTPEVKANVGRFLRGLVTGGRADDARELEDERKALGATNDPSGGYTVGGGLSAAWIDLLRARMVLSRAGALTVPMDTGKLTIAKVTGDPTVSWHGENAAVSDSGSTFGAVNLTAKTAVALVKISLELAQDSANIERILQNTIVSAMANAIDSAGLNGVTADAAAAPAGIFNLSGRNSVTSIGAPSSWDFLVDAMYELMADNVEQESIGAFIAHPAVWKKMRKLKTGISSDNTPLAAPDEVAKLPKLWTTAAPLTGGTTAKGVVANWRDLLFGVRQAITVRVLQEAFLGTNLQIAVLCYARCDFGAARAESFCTTEGITV